MYEKNNTKYKFNQRYWEHDFKFIDAQHVKKGDWICYPNIYKEETPQKIFALWDAFKDVGRIDFRINNNPLLSNDFWWFVGIWLAEGWVYEDKNKNITICTSHNSNEIHIINKLKNIIKTISGRELTTTNRDDNSICCQFNSKQIGLFLTQYFGKYANGKYISEIIKYLPHEMKKELILGYIAGDGSIIKTKSGGKNIKITSVSLNLLEGIQDMLFSLNCVSSINRLRKEKVGLIRNAPIYQKEAYSLNIHDHSCQFILNDHVSKSKTQRISDCYLDVKYIYFRVKKIKELNYCGFVHNFTTSTGTFLCENITTHNCADVARGDGQDFSAFHILDVENLNQCAEYKGQIDTTSFGHMLVSIATEYNKALLIVENTGIGWAPLQVVIDAGYPNTFYSTVDLKYVEVQRQLITRFYSEEKKMVPGFSTTLRTRPLIVSRLEQYFRDKSVNIYSTRTLGELETFVWNKGKVEALDGYNDDLCLSLGMGLWVRDTAVRLRQESQEYSKLMIDKIGRAEYTGSAPVYTNRNSTLAQEYWYMPTGRDGRRESLTWLL